MKVFLIEAKWFCSIVIQMVKIVLKERSGSAYRFQFRRDPGERIIVTGLEQYQMTSTKDAEPYLDDYFKHELFDNRDIDPRYEDDVIKNLKFLDLNDSVDAVTFSEKFFEKEFFWKVFDLFSGNNVFNSVCK